MPAGPAPADLRPAHWALRAAIVGVSAPCEKGLPPLLALTRHVSKRGPPGS